MRRNEFFAAKICFFSAGPPGSSIEAVNVFNDYLEQGDDEGEPDGGFEPCQICGILINTLHPSAVANHMRAHTKNDELRNQMIQVYGTEVSHFLHILVV